MNRSMIRNLAVATLIVYPAFAIGADRVPNVKPGSDGKLHWFFDGDELRSVTSAPSATAIFTAMCPSPPSPAPRPCDPCPPSSAGAASTS